jgi:hypothetical protein
MHPVCMYKVVICRRYVLLRAASPSDCSAPYLAARHGDKIVGSTMINKSIHPSNPTIKTPPGLRLLLHVMEHDRHCVISSCQVVAAARKLPKCAPVLSTCCWQSLVVCQFVPWHKQTTGITYRVWNAGDIAAPAWRRTCSTREGPSREIT